MPVMSSVIHLCTDGDEMLLGGNWIVKSKSLWVIKGFLYYTAIHGVSTEQNWRHISKANHYTGINALLFRFGFAVDRCFSWLKKYIHFTFTLGVTLAYLMELCKNFNQFIFFGFARLFYVYCAKFTKNVIWEIWSCYLKVYFTFFSWS